jgi:magnesium chelatase family protein
MELTTEVKEEGSDLIRERVRSAREIQKKRYLEEGILSNSGLKPKQMRRFCKLDEESRKLIELAMERLGFSARAYNRILKIARTIADLAFRDAITAPDIAEAIQYRSLDRKLFSTL